MKTILAYGDSLTHGADPFEAGKRHGFEDRWPIRLEAGLDGKARVIAEGLGGRTTVFDDWSGPADRNGARVLPTLLASHAPLDLVVIMLGSNDMKDYICGSALGAAMGMKRLVEIVRNQDCGTGGEPPAVILVAPPHCVATDHADLGPMFGHGVAESRALAGHYARVARDIDCHFFDAATVARADPADGVHLDAANTRAIGDALAPVVKGVLGL